MLIGARRRVAEDLVVRVDARVEQADDGVGCGTYTIVEGDYLTRVAEKLNTTVDELNEANEDTDGYDSFYVGLEINEPC